MATQFTLTSADLEAIKHFEGCKLYAYRDSAGVPTIGYGHTAGVRMGQAITQKQAETFLREDLRKVEAQVNTLGVCKTQGQFFALTDFVFNLGLKRLLDSTLLKRIRSGAKTADIQNEFKRWVYAGGQKLEGLVKRRAHEALRWAQ